MEKMSFCNNLFLIIAAIICVFPILEIPKKIAATSPRAKNVTMLLSTLTQAALLITSSILLVDATTKAFLYYRF